MEGLEHALSATTYFLAVFPLNSHLTEHFLQCLLSADPCLRSPVDNNKPLITSYENNSSPS